MKNVKILSSGIAMLICFSINAQEKTSSETISKETKSTEIIICTPSRSVVNEPLYILNGTPINAKEFVKINPSDIQDVKIIKTITSLNLSCRSNNPVIIITTKKER